MNISLKAYKEREKSRNANHGRCVVPPSVFISTHLLHPDIFFFLVCHPEALETVLLFYISKQTRTQYCKMSWKTHPCPLMPFDVLKYKHLSGSHFLPPLPFIAASLPHHPLARCWKRAWRTAATDSTCTWPPGTSLTACLSRSSPLRPIPQPSFKKKYWLSSRYTDWLSWLVFMGCFRCLGYLGSGEISHLSCGISLRYAPFWLCPLGILRVVWAMRWLSQQKRPHLWRELFTLFL